MPKSWHSLFPPVQVFAQLCLAVAWGFLMLARCLPTAVVQGGAPLAASGRDRTKTRGKSSVAARSLWLPCFPASYIAVTLTLLTYSKGYLLLEGSSRAGNFSRKPNFVCLVCSRADKGKVFVHEPVILRSQSAACCWCDTGHGIGVCWTAGVQRSGSLSSEPGLESTSLSNVSGVCLPTCPSAG